MKIEETIVKAKELTTWMVKCYEGGGEVKFIVPAHYSLTMENYAGVQTMRMDVETYRILWRGLEHRYVERFGEDMDD